MLEIGEVLVDGEEFLGRSKEFADFAQRARESRTRGGTRPEAFPFEGGHATVEGLESIDLAAAPGGAPFSPIGIGRPLAIEIQHVYAGDLPLSPVLRRSPDVLVSSAARSWATTDAAPRALNRLAPDVGRRSSVGFPAGEPGSHLVFYSKATTDHSISVTIEMVADSFPKPAFDQVAKLLGTASNLPVFASANLYLLGGSLLAKAIGALGEKLTDGKAFFSDTLDILFSTPGIEAAQPRKALLVNRGSEGEFRGKCQFAPGSYEVVSKETGAAYAGAAPYVAVSIDGGAKPSYEGFTSAAVTAATLDRFYHVDGGDQDMAKMLSEAFQLYNDARLARQAEDTRARVAAAPEGSEERKEAQKLLEAILANIENDAIRKQAEGGTPA